LQRIEDRRAVPALLTLIKEPHTYTRALAARGLGTLKDSSAAPALLPLVDSSDRLVAFEAVRALGRLGGALAAPVLVKVVQSSKLDPMLRLEAVTALGTTSGDGVADLLLDLLGDPNPSMRAAALTSLARLDAEGFVTVLSGLDADPQWTVRAALARTLGGLTAQAGMPRLRMMLDDMEPRVIPSVLQAIAALQGPESAALMIEKLKSDDPVIRTVAARLIGELKPADAAPALVDAFHRGERDTTYAPRAAALKALVAYGAAQAVPLLEEAFKDKDWAVRVYAASLVRQLDPAADVGDRIRPAPTYKEPAFYDTERFLQPSVSPQAYIDTDRGTIQLELAVLEAPLTVENFVTLARKGFYDGMPIHRVVSNFVIQGGDPRGDGEGGPGYTIRDELSQLPFLRGTVGMALDWPDTGGSQFFITHSPQPHLDARYSVFGRVISGIEVVDKIQIGDVIRRVRVWDGKTAPDR
jgi:cyclophilin family peptidyl-prolyl cis-trans isomerase/HEAT repeat protein